VNWLSSRIVGLYIKWLVFSFCFFVNVSVKAWEVDFSRRQNDLQKMRMPASVPQAVPVEPEKVQPEGASFWKSVLPSAFVNDVASATGPIQNIVILHTEQGFVPESVTLKKGFKYKVHLVNISEKDRNVSFILDAFSEHHGVYYGKMKVFELVPKAPGIFSFVSPETAKQGRMVILGDESRLPARE